ncbi:hypothetical protein ACVWZS_000989, partial [Pseudomonas fragi]
SGISFSERICKELEAEDSIASFLASAAGRQAQLKIGPLSLRERVGVRARG